MRAVATWALTIAALSPATGSASFTLFESDPVRPVALAHDRSHVYVVNTPDGRLEILAVNDAGLIHEASVPVGLEPVAVAARANGEVWVVNHLSDSVSIVDTASDPPRVVRTLPVGDEPRDIVFAGSNHARAFVTTAHRGQNSPVDPQLSVAGVGRADVWVFDANNTDAPPSVLTLFGDTPRALAATAGGERVYAAVFKSGNRTSIVSALAICNGGELAEPCELQGRTLPGGLPGPDNSLEGFAHPRTGMIVKHDPGRDAWEDELGRDWSAAIDISLPDKDVFAIDALANPPVELRSYAGVGTVLFNMAVNPVSGRVYVSNTEARNDVRFEPDVRGRLHESRITVLDDAEARPRHLNKHIDYNVIPSPEGTKERSVAIPLGMAVTADGATLYLAAFGSDRVAVYDTRALENDSFEPDASRFIAVSGGGPSGLVLDDERRRLYVATRFDNGISVIDLDSRTERQHLSFFSPEPASVVHGRRFLYDARATSSNGEAACASCHVFGDWDDLAWDLGEPEAAVLENPNPVNPLIAVSELFLPFWTDFHPMKGPLTTQTLRGLVNHGPMHWRGDRTGAFLPGRNASDEREALRQFNPAFVSLLGNHAPLPPADIDALIEFVLQIVPPPNPIRNLDGTLTPTQQLASDEFFTEVQPPCVTCHQIDRAAGIFGTDLSSTANGQSAQIMKVPSLRQVYRKVGMFGMFPVLPGFRQGATGDQVRGFGFLHDGSAGVFIERAFDYIMIFDTNLHPVVGQQATLAAGATAAVSTRIDLLHQRALLGECDLVVKGTVDGQARGWVLGTNGTLQADRVGEAPWTAAALRALASAAGQELTYTCWPPGSGVRAGIDRDGDGSFDRDELDRGTDPADPSSGGVPTATPTIPPTATPSPTPPPCPGDCDGSGDVTVDEILRGVQMALGMLSVDECPPFDTDSDGNITVDEILLAVNAALSGC